MPFLKISYFSRRHSFLRYPEQSEEAFGVKRGCFEKPQSDRPPKTNISCKNILPLKFSENETDRNAMLNADPLSHPDSNEKTRYCLGTRLQMRKDGKGSHKTIECTYHSLDLSEDGKLLKGEL